jgi:hypothetical protein
VRRERPAGARLIETLDEHGHPLGPFPWVPYGEGWEIPAEFEYGGTIDAESGTELGAWSIWVQVVDGVAECVAVRCWSIGGPAIRAAVLRELPLARLVREGVLLVSRPAEEDPKRRINWPDVETALGERENLAATHRQRARKGAVTDELLQDVARIYREALAGGRPTAEVAERLDYSRASAGRLVMRARRRGLLPATEPRRARA